MKIAYFLDAFPVISETFIVREILALMRYSGAEIEVFARHSSEGMPRGSIVHHDARKLVKDTIYLESLRKAVSKPELLIFHLLSFIRHPIRYFFTLLFSVRSGSRAMKIFRTVVLYSSELKRKRIRHLHAHFALDACTTIMMLSKLTGIPFSFTVHAHDIFIPGLAEHLEIKINQSKFVACISDFNRQHLINQFPNVNPGKLKTVHCGMDVEDFMPIHNENSIFTMVSVGRLHPQKGYQYLIQACERLKLKKIKFLCNIIGEGDERPVLEDTIARLGLSGLVVLLGAKEQQEVLSAVKKADLFVLPCIRDKNGFMDGIPVALMEAMALEVPVASTDISGIPELIEKDAGYLVKQKNSKELAMAIEAFLRLPVLERKKVGKAGRNIVEKEFSIKTEVLKLSALIMAT